MLNNLKIEFVYNTDITFINISLDKDSNRQRQFINKNKPKGIQLIFMGKANTRVVFEISGIPKRFVVNSESELTKIILIASINDK